MRLTGPLCQWKTKLLDSGNSNYVLPNKQDRKIFRPLSSFISVSRLVNGVPSLNQTGASEQSDEIIFRILFNIRLIGHQFSSGQQLTSGCHVFMHPFPLHSSPLVLFFMSCYSPRFSPRFMGLSPFPLVMVWSSLIHSINFQLCDHSFDVIYILFCYKLLRKRVLLQSPDLPTRKAGIDHVFGSVMFNLHFLNHGLLQKPALHCRQRVR